MNKFVQGIPIQHSVFSYRCRSDNEMGYTDTVYPENIQTVLQLGFHHKKTFIGLRHEVKTGAMAGVIVHHHVHTPTMTILSKSSNESQDMVLIVEDYRTKKGYESVYEYTIIYLQKQNTEIVRKMMLLTIKFKLLEKQWKMSKEFIHELYSSSSKYMTSFHQLDMDYSPTEEDDVVDE